MSLFIPIILGTTRPKRRSLQAAKLIEKIGQNIEDIKVQLVDPRDFDLSNDGNDPENKIPEYTEIVKMADAFFIVTPEYNHGYPGSLKSLLDKELANYKHKPVAFAGVSDGYMGGVRAIEALIGSVRTMGMVAVSNDVYFPKIQEMFDEQGEIKDPAQIERIEKVYRELIWMANTLKLGRESSK